MYGIYGNIYHQYTPNVSIYTIHGSYGIWDLRATVISPWPMDARDVAAKNRDISLNVCNDFREDTLW